MEVKVKENKIYNGKQNIFQSHEENWLKKKIGQKNSKELEPKCFGFDRVFLVFLKDGASELCVIVTTLMFKIFEEERTPEQWKVARIYPFFKKRDKEKKSNLCSFTKVYEKLLLHWFQKIQEKENVDLKGRSQYGFKKNFYRNSFP